MSDEQQQYINQEMPNILNEDGEILNQAFNQAEASDDIGMGMH